MDTILIIAILVVLCSVTIAYLDYRDHQTLLRRIENLNFKLGSDQTNRCAKFEQDFWRHVNPLITQLPECEHRSARSVCAHTVRVAIDENLSFAAAVQRAENYLNRIARATAPLSPLDAKTQLIQQFEKLTSGQSTEQKRLLINDLTQEFAYMDYALLTGVEVA